MPFPPDIIPIGVYMQPANKLAAWKARGATFVITDNPKPDDNGPTRDEYFAAAHAAGLGVVMGAKDGYLSPEALRADLARPGHVGVQKQDEPDGWGKLLKDSAGQLDVPASVARWNAHSAALRAVAPNVPLVGTFAGSQVYWAGTKRDIANDKVIIQDDYKAWSEGCDVTSADWYFIAEGRDPANLALWQGRMIDRLVSWSVTKKVFAFVECCAVHGLRGRAPTPEEMRAQAWVGLIHGAEGLKYFPLRIPNRPKYDHDFSFDATPAELIPAVTSLNAEVQGYADYILHGTRVRTGEKAVWTRPDGATLTAEVQWNAVQKRWDTWVQATAPTPTPGERILIARVKELERTLEASREVAEKRHEENVMLRNRLDRIRTITNE